MTTSEMFRGVFGNEAIKHVIVPLKLGNDHWCDIVVHVERQAILYYDPMASSYTVIARKVAMELSRLGARYHGSQFRLRGFEANSGHQLVNYNCKVFLLLFFEEVLLNQRAGRVNRHALQFLRYRYMCMRLRR